jgi:hypothetical protein
VSDEWPFFPWFSSSLIRSKTLLLYLPTAHRETTSFSISQVVADDDKKKAEGIRRRHPAPDFFFFFLPYFNRSSRRNRDDVA